MPKKRSEQTEPTQPRKHVFYTSQAREFIDALPVEEGRRLYLESLERAKKSPTFPAVLRRVQEEQRAARALRLMRERANITQREVARRMAVKAPAVSRLERFGASTIRALTDYARACGYRIRIVAESLTDCFAMA